MLIKTSDLIDLTLDWATYNALHPNMKPVPSTFRHQYYCGQISFSTRWAQGGPIIERERIELGSYAYQWQATMHLEYGSIYERGPTPLIAAMRCYVASKLGDSVDIPDELIG